MPAIINNDSNKEIEMDMETYISIIDSIIKDSDISTEDNNINTLTWNSLSKRKYLQCLYPNCKEIPEKYFFEYIEYNFNDHKLYRAILSLFGKIIL